VAQEDAHGRLRARIREQSPERGVEAPVDRQHRVAHRGGERGVVQWMVGVVLMEELVPDAMRFREDGEEQVPFLACEQRAGAFRLAGDLRLQRADELGDAGRRALRVVTVVARLLAEPPIELGERRGGLGHRRVERIVHGPVDDVDAVQLWR
jgi:hypothetical protein